MPARPTSRRPHRFAGLALALGMGLSGGFLGPLDRAHAAPGQFDPSRCADGKAGPMPDPWSTRRLGLAEAHTLATGDGVRIAILETGIDTVDNPVLSQRRITDYDLTGYDKAEKDEDDPGPSRVDCNQGSALATLIGGEAAGFVSVAPEARILGLRTNQLSTDPPDDPEPTSSLVTGVDTAIELDADVLLIPRPVEPTAAYRTAIRAALADGIVIVTAVGEPAQQAPDAASPAPLPGYPASEAGVISVGATGADDLPVPQAAVRPDNEPVTVAAPGAGVATAYASAPDGASWVPASGSALAAAQVAGVAALLKQREPDLTSAQVADRLARTADVPGVTTPDLRIGAGIVNPRRALAERPGQVEDAQTPTAEPPADPRDRPDPDRWARRGALVAGAVAVVVVGVLVAVAAAVPGGRRRRWRGGP